MATTDPCLSASQILDVWILGQLGQDQQKKGKDSDRHIQPSKFQPGDWIMVLTQAN